MTPYANVHLAFEAMRVRALHHAKITAYPDTATPEDLASQRGGAPQAPRVLILGPENSGKTTVTKTLLNYATRAGQDWCPMLVNVDPGEVCLVSYLPAYIHQILTHEPFILIILGRPYAPRSPLRNPNTNTHPYFHPRARFRILSNHSSFTYIHKCPITIWVLVRTFRDKTKPSSPGPPHSQSR